MVVRIYLVLFVVYDSTGGDARAYIGSGQQDVVDQPGVSHKGGNGNERAARDLSLWIERGGIHNFEVVQARGGLVRHYLFSSGDQLDCIPLTLIESIPHLGQCSMQNQRGLALPRAEARITRAHG
jgi:hypothetical protein